MATILPSYAQQGSIPKGKATIFDFVESELPITPFDPAIHLNYQPPSTRHAFTELGLPVPKGCPDICYTEPFQLFSREGVRMIRREVFRRSFLDKYMRSWERAPCLISGHAHAKNDGTFMKQAWYHPVTQAAINHAFGYALKLQSGENDMGYINVQLGVDGIEGVYKLTETPTKPLPDAEALPASDYDHNLIDKWHKDMTPVVLVLMLSDTSTMIGGETAIKTGNGQIIKARGASVGGAVMMAGGYLEHAALRASNCAERLSLVNSYCFADPDADDSATTLKSVNLQFDSLPNAMNTLMAQKLRRLRERCDLALDRIQHRRENGEAPSREEVESWVKDQIHLLKHTSWEMFERMPNHMGQEIPEGALCQYLAEA
ncbi:Fc.00g034480.m01.CDS01 [Cosmosporella sp. VM-42]